MNEPLMTSTLAFSEPSALFIVRLSEPSPGVGVIAMPDSRTAMPTVASAVVVALSS